MQPLRTDGLAAPARRTPLTSAAAIAGDPGVAEEEHLEVERPSPVASRLAIVSSRWRITRPGPRCGPASRCAIATADRAADAAAAAGRTQPDRIAAEGEHREADHGVPEADHVPWQHGGEAAAGRCPTASKPFAAEDTRHRQRRAAMVSTHQHREQRAAPTQGPAARRSRRGLGQMLQGAFTRSSPFRSTRAAHRAQHRCAFGVSRRGSGPERCE